MNYPKDTEDDLTKTDETTISSSASKNFKRRRKTEYPKINYTINKTSLSSIKEVNNSLPENDNFFLLSENINEENKENKVENFIQITDIDNIKEDNEDNKTKDSNDDSSEININLKSKKTKKEKSGNNSNNEKKEPFIDIPIEAFCNKEKENNENSNDIIISIDNNIDTKNSKKISEKENYPKKNSKNKIDFKFLEEEELEEEHENDYKAYIQKAYDEEEEFKIIYEFNKLPFKPKIEIIDLSIFDNTSILKCIAKCYFDKNEQTFNIKLFFIYLSSENNNLLQSKDTNEEFLNFFSKNENKEDNIQENLDNQGDEDTIGLTLQLKKFKFSTGKDRNATRRSLKIKKKEKLESFNSIIEITEKEDLASYKNNRKIFYILTIQKNIFIKSKRFFSPEKIGIHNEGNTCYMNSIIQSLYNNPFMLKNIMQIDIENNELLSKQDNNLHKEVISSLQKIFYDLFKEKKAIKIINIFYAFNWERTYWNSPQDAEEIYIKIFEIISNYNNDIKINCEGILENTIDVDIINFKSTREENFFFMQLDLEKNNSVEECLEHFFESEKLNGDNKYQYINTEGEKILYDAEKYYKFKKIPNFLFLQLKRFTFDPITGDLDKKNKAIKYNEEIDLTKYLHINENNNSKRIKKSKSKKLSEEEKEIYVLYCILVHSGSVDNGHYYCIAKDFKNKVYIKYNDTSITTAEKKEVFNQLFGGEEIEYSIQNKFKDKPKLEPWYEVIEEKKQRKRNAYILIYVKKNEIKNLFNEDDIKNIFNIYGEKIKKNNKNDDFNNNYFDKDITFDKNIGNGYDLIGKNKNKNKQNKNNKDFKNKNKQYNYPKDNSNNAHNKYDFNGYRKKLGQKNFKIINSEINMNFKSEDVNYGQLLTEVNGSLGNDIDKNYPKKRNKASITKSSQSKQQLYKYVGDNNRYHEPPKILNLISPNKFQDFILRDKQMNYFLVPDISKRYKGTLLIKYNIDIYVKDVIPHIRDQLKNEELRNIFEEIVNSKGYKLALINNFGFFIKFLEDEDEDITKLLKYDSPEKVKHLCFYNLKEININDLIVVHFMKKSVFDQIKKKSDNIYENFYLDLTSVPCFIINEKIANERMLDNKVRDLFVNYFGSSALKGIKFEYYIIVNADILDLNVTKIEYKKVDDYYILIYFSNSYEPSNNTYGIKKPNITKLLVII